NPAAVTIRATSVASPSATGTAAANIVGPPNPGAGLGTANLAAARFLEQAAFGPTTAEIAHVQQVGINNWLTEQFQMPETPIPDPGASGSAGFQSLSGDGPRFPGIGSSLAPTPSRRGSLRHAGNFGLDTATTEPRP